MTPSYGQALGENFTPTITIRVALTMFGLTTPCVSKACALLLSYKTVVSREHPVLELSGIDGSHFPEGRLASDNFNEISTFNNMYMDCRSNVSLYTV